MGFQRKVAETGNTIGAEGNLMLSRPRGSKVNGACLSTNQSA
jgi:hypothetical protein